MNTHRGLRPAPSRGLLVLAPAGLPATRPNLLVVFSCPRGLTSDRASYVNSANVFASQRPFSGASATVSPQVRRHAFLRAFLLLRARLVVYAYMYTLHLFAFHYIHFTFIPIPLHTLYIYSHSITYTSHLFAFHYLHFTFIRIHTFVRLHDVLFARVYHFCL